MAKRIAFSILCTLLVLVVILTGIVIRRVSRIMFSALPTDTSPAVGGPVLSPTSPSSPNGEGTEPTQPGHTHEFVLTNTIAATCEGYGWSIYTCSTCGYVNMPEEERKAPLGHNYNEGEVVPPPVPKTASQSSAVVTKAAHKFRKLNVVEVLEEVVSGESLAARSQMMRLLDLVMKKATVYRTPEGELSVHIYPKLPKSRLPSS